MSLRDISRLIRTSWIMITILTLVGAAGAATASFLAVPIYTSTTQLFVSVAPSSLATPGDLVQANNFAIQKVISYVSVVPSERVMTTVIDELDLDTTPEELATRVTSSTALNTVILSINVSDPNPQQAATLASAVSDAFSNLVINELESPVGGGPGPVKVEVLQNPSIPTDPSQPQTALNIALGAFIGFVVGLVLAIVLLLLDTRIHKLSDAAAIAESPILGGIGLGSRSSKRTIAMLERPFSEQAESYRSLRTTLQAARPDGGDATTFVITSSVAGEGKTTVVANLGVAFAENGARVLLIDADLRDPGLAKKFDIVADTGLTDVLSGTAALQASLSTSKDGLVTILTSGAAVPNPSELLGSQAMLELLAKVARDYDVVLLDSPPLLPVTDAAVVGRAVDSVILIAAAGAVTKSELRASVAILRNIKARLLGVAVTKVPLKGPDSYRYARYETDVATASRSSQPGPA